LRHALSRRRYVADSRGHSLPAILDEALAVADEFVA
jgi:hypothetical protein